MMILPMKPAGFNPPSVVGHTPIYAVLDSFFWFPDHVAMTHFWIDPQSSSLLKVRIPLFDGHKLLQDTSHFRTFLSLVGNIYTLLGPRQPNKSGPYPVGFDFCVFG